LGLDLNIRIFEETHTFFVLNTVIMKQIKILKTHLQRFSALSDLQ
jgi:hypothetical protein